MIMNLFLLNSLFLYFAENECKKIRQLKSLPHVLYRLFNYLIKIFLEYIFPSLVCTFII